MTTKCLAKDRNNEKCRNNHLDQSKFCKFHQYMNDYSEEMLNNLTLCSGCKKMYYLVNLKQCDKCKQRSDKNRITHKNEKIICKKKECKFEKTIENDYCGKHQKEYFKEETELIGKKVCTNYIRGCYTQMNKNDFYSRCLKCREKERVGYTQNDCELIVLDDLTELEKELQNFDNKPKKNNIIIVDDENNNKIETQKIKFSNLIFEDNINNSDMTNESIIKPNKKEILSRHYFIPEYMTHTTNLILEIIDNYQYLNIDFPHMIEFLDYDYKINKFLRQNDAIKKNDKYLFDNITECANKKYKHSMPEHCFIDKFERIVTNCILCRIHRRIKDNRDTRKEWKKQWKEDNYDKYALYWQNFRGRKIEEKGVEKYLEDNAKVMKNWRDKNPDKTKVANEKKKENIKIHYQNYIRDANKKNLKFELSFEDFEEIVKQKCYYCAEIQEKGFNGIDKINCGGNYVKENCVSCCEMCNYMKGTLTYEIFLNRIEHILTYQGYINGKLYPEYFANHISTNYNRYKKRAEEKNLDFEISEDDYYSLIIKKCYICGKKPEEEHINGIDRIDIDKGYTHDNIESCCGECNYMKNKFTLQDFFDKLRKIKKYKLKEFEIINSEFKYQHKIKQKKYLDKQKKINDTEELKQNIREKQRICKQKYREKIKNNKPEVIDENIKTIDNNSKITHLNKKTPEQLKEEARIRKQKQRNKLKEKYGDEEYKKKRALELAEYRKKKREEK